MTVRSPPVINERAVLGAKLDGESTGGKRGRDNELTLEVIVDGEARKGHETRQCRW